jgi:hypothetical protein
MPMPQTQSPHSEHITRRTKNDRTKTVDEATAKLSQLLSLVNPIGFDTVLVE